jgi:hypothetical protein
MEREEEELKQRLKVIHAGKMKSSSPADNDVQQSQTTQGTGEFTGYWLIKDASGTPIYRLGGIGNNQGDANRLAAQWLRNNGYTAAGENFEVVPEMR